MSNLMNLTGQKFGRLTVISRYGTQHGRVYWKCKCDCGNEFVTAGESLRKGRTRSCGCLRVENARAMGKKYKTRYISYKGETKSLFEWAREIGISPDTLLGRLRIGWSVERALTEKVRGYHNDKD